MTYTTDPDNDNFQLNRLINAFKRNQVDGTQEYQDRNAYDKMVNWRLPVIIQVYKKSRIWIYV